MKEEGVLTDFLDNMGIRSFIYALGNNVKGSGEALQSF